MNMRRLPKISFKLARPMNIARYFCALLTTMLFCIALEAKGVKVAFYKKSFSTFRGTDVALFDYAHFNEEILGNTTYIFNESGGIPEKVELPTSAFLDVSPRESRFFGHYNGVSIS
jgi:hypothetical protein